MIYLILFIAGAIVGYTVGEIKLGKFIDKTQAQLHQREIERVAAEARARTATPNNPNWNNNLWDKVNAKHDGGAPLR